MTAHVVEVRVAHQDGLEPALCTQIEATGERARVDRERTVEHERARSVLGRLSAVATGDEKPHA